jgi:hypothetical protein
MQKTLKHFELRINLNLDPSDKPRRQKREVTQKNELFALRENYLYHSANTAKSTPFLQDSCNPSGTGEFYLYGSGTFEIRQEIIDSPGSSPF